MEVVFDENSWMALPRHRCMNNDASCSLCEPRVKSPKTLLAFFELASLRE